MEPRRREAGTVRHHGVSSQPSVESVMGTPPNGRWLGSPHSDLRLGHADTQRSCGRSPRLTVLRYHI